MIDADRHLHEMLPRGGFVRNGGASGAVRSTQRVYGVSCAADATQPGSRDNLRGMEATRRVLLEIAVDSVDDARAAERYGADRIELSRNLAAGGFTPDAETLSAVRAAAHVPLMILIRPHTAGRVPDAGLDVPFAGDFRYSAEDIARIADEAAAAVSLGVDGIVVGALDGQGRVHESHCRMLIERCAGRAAVFHRAFDLTPDPLEALERLFDLGFARILTSGRARRVDDADALELLARLNDRAAGKIEILPCGGIRPHNAATIVAATDCHQLHSACRRAGEDRLDVQMLSELRAAIDRAT